MLFNINSTLLPVKAHFFFFFAALAPVLPFLPIYAKQLGIDTVGVGVVFAGESRETRLSIFVKLGLSSQVS